MKALLAILALLVVLGLGWLLYSYPTAPAEMSEAERAQIETEVEQITRELYDAARQADPEPMMAYVPEETGLCVWGTNINDCREVFDRYYAAWTSEDERRLERQEMDGEDIQVTAVTRTVAVAVHTTQENRAYYTTGEVYRARFASTSVFVLTEDGWKIHSSQQASWPIEDEGEG